MKLAIGEKEKVSMMLFPEGESKSTVQPIYRQIRPEYTDKMLTI
jgi:hypothetical protein